MSTIPNTHCVLKMYVGRSFANDVNATNAYLVISLMIDLTLLMEGNGIDILKLQLSDMLHWSENQILNSFLLAMKR